MSSETQEEDEKSTAKNHRISRTLQDEFHELYKTREVHVGVITSRGAKKKLEEDVKVAYQCARREKCEIITRTTVC